MSGLQRRFVRDSLIYGASLAFSRGLQFVLLPVYTRVLSPRDYGALDMLVLFSAVANLVVSLEISQATARYFATTDDENERQRCAAAGFLFTAVTFAAFVLSVAVFGDEIAAALLGAGDWRAAVLAVAIATAANGIFFQLQDLLRWRGLTLRHATATVVYAATAGAAAVGFVVLYGAGVAGIFLGQTVGAVAGTCAVGWGTISIALARLAPDVLRRMLAFSAPLVPSSLSVLACLNMDRLAVRYFLGLEDLGIYGVAARLASVMSFVVAAVQTAMTPLVYAAYRQPGTPDEIARLFAGFFTLAGILVIGFSCFGRELLAFAAPGAFADGAALVGILALAIVGYGSYMFAPGIFLANRTTAFAVANAGIATLNGLLCTLLVPRFGIAGAASATLGAALVAAITYFRLGTKGYPIPVSWKRTGLALMAVFGALVVSLLDGLSVWQSPLSLGWRALAFAMLSSALVCAFLRRGGSRPGLAAQDGV